MTMQVALRAAKGLVVASDTKVRTTEKEVSDRRYTAVGIVNRAKLKLSQRHGILVGLSGWGSEEGDLAQELADHLSTHNQLPGSIGALLRAWGDRVVERVPRCSLLVVSPATESYPFWKLQVKRGSDCEPSSSYLINGNENNSAIFWPEYFRWDKELYDLQMATRIAAFTILMGAELNPFGVGGLEIWRYESEWKPALPAEIAQLRADFKRLQESLHSVVQR